MAFDDRHPNSFRGVAPVNRSPLNDHRGEASGGFVSVAGVLFLLLVAGMVMAAMGHWRMTLLFVGLSVLLFLMVGNGPIVRWLAAALQSPAFFEKPRDFSGMTAIVLLGDGSIVEPNGERLPRWLAHSRIDCAVRLYRAAISAGSVAHVIITGDDTGEHAIRSVYADRLQALGVLAEHIRVEREGRNTYRQAELTTRMVGAEHHDRVILVTSGLHMKRALRYFRHFGLQPIPAASDYVMVPITPIPRGENFAIAEIALHQYIGLARLQVYNAFGLNKPSEPNRHSAVGTSS